MAKVKTYSVPDEEVKDFERILFDLGRRDRWSDSRIILEAVKEYGKRHLPGNPQLILANYIPELNMPFSESAQEKLSGEHKIVTCPRCKGSGKAGLGVKCSICNGQGKYVEE